MRRILGVTVVVFCGLLVTNAYGQGGCMHHGGGMGSSMGGMGGPMGMGMGGSMGGISSTIQQGYMQNQMAQQQFMQQMYMQQRYEQQQAAVRQAAKAERRAEKIVMLKERRTNELAKKQSTKVNASSAPQTMNLAEALLAGKK